MEQSKIAIFGGTFNPFTLAHAAIIKQLICTRKYSCIYVVPSILNYKESAKSRSIDNLKLTCTAVSQISTAFNDYIHVQHICPPSVNGFNECTRVEPWIYDIDLALRMIQSSPATYEWIASNHYFIDTLSRILSARAFQNALPCEIDLVIGGDQLQEFKTWHRYEEILKMCKLVVFNNRNGSTVSSDIPHDDMSLDFRYMNISSTAIREMVEDGDFTAYYENTFYGPESRFKTEILSACNPSFKLALKTPIFNVGTLENTNVGFDPVVIDSPDWACIVAKEDGHYVMVKQLRYGLFKEMVEFPCGMVELGEDPKKAAIRELAEETGIKICDESGVKLLGVVAANPAFMSNRMHIFYVDLFKTEYEIADQNLDPHEDLTIMNVSSSIKVLGEEAISGMSTFMLNALMLAQAYEKEGESTNA